MAHISTNISGERDTFKGADRLETQSTLITITSMFSKRVFDIAFTLLVAPFVIVLLCIVAPFIKSDGGSLFFGHKRVGKDGRQFKCWKIRTMVADADVKLLEYLENNPAEKATWLTDFKLENDPRITRLGALLRKTSIDELPQFFNVFKGEMSIVGPRPVTMEEISSQYQEAADAVLSVRPGVTGPWQVSGRNSITYAERIQIDLQYVSRVSFWNDISIIFQTVKVMVLRTGQ
ncbi:MULTISPECIES: sugar transferase [Pacificibacter]|uniref:sugar transferase n=1 Tax=Pacificibacter TaxID=1042323 RepID=UPI002090D3CF|nr:MULTISPECIES: sugar transferase [Pacificibacter]MDO6616935.1 sugar transferase [Pacificibacter sp. 1_MG-2023]